MNFHKTNPNLKPKHRFLQIIHHHLLNEDFRFVKSSNAFKRDLAFGEQTISFSFINTMGLIHGIQIVHTVKIKAFEKLFKKGFPDYPWNKWTCLYHVYGNNKVLYDESSQEYSDESLNEAAFEFFEVIKPKIDAIVTPNYLEDLYLVLQDFSKPTLSFIRIEKRVLLLIWLTKELNKPNLAKITNQSINLFQASNEPYKRDLDKVMSVIELFRS